jgi:hypothetical protein
MHEKEVDNQLAPERIINLPGQGKAMTAHLLALFLPTTSQLHNTFFQDFKARDASEEVKE